MKTSCFTYTLTLFTVTHCESIWNVGKFKGTVPEVSASEINPSEFFEKFHRAPFVVRGFHKTLDQLAAEKGTYTHSLDWLAATIGDQAKISSLEGELQETRLAPVIHNIKWKYFFEKFTSLDIYAVSQAPRNIRPFLELLPTLACGGNSFRMLPPYMWISGGLKPSKSVVHADSHHNQHCVLKGSKKFMLIPPFVPVATPAFGWVNVEADDGSKLEGYEDSYGDYAARVDYDNVDTDALPGWKDVPWLLAELNAGDCLYMPIRWFHYVESKAEPTVTWHIWFHLMSQWVDSDTCPADGRRLFTSQCFFKDDQQESQGKGMDWGDFIDRMSLCDFTDK